MTLNSLKTAFYHRVHSMARWIYCIIGFCFKVLIGVNNIKTCPGKWKNCFYRISDKLYVPPVCVWMGVCLLKKHKSHIVTGAWGRSWETAYGALSASCGRAKCRVSGRRLLPGQEQTQTQKLQIYAQMHWDAHTHTHQLREKTSGLMTLCVRSTVETLRESQWAKAVVAYDTHTHTRYTNSIQIMQLINYT